MYADMVQHKSNSDNAESLRSELNNAREREAATRAILNVISSSSHDEGPVLQEIVETAARLCSAPFSCLFLCNKERTHLTVAAHNGTKSRFVEQMNADPLSMDPEQSATAQAIAMKSTIQIEDVNKDPITLAGQRHRLHTVQIEGIRTMLAVPLLIDKKAVGVILLYRREVLLFTEDEIGVAETFATQAVIAIEKVRQFKALTARKQELDRFNQELETRLEREAATREILEVISRSRGDERPVFDAILNRAAQLCRAPFGFLAMVTNDGENIAIMAEGAEPFEPFRPGWQWPISSALLVARSVREKTVLQIEDTTQDSLYAQGDEDRVTVVEAGIRTVLTAPLVSGGMGIGSINLFRREQQPFTPDEIALVQTFAKQAVIAIENVRQFRELQTQLEQQTATVEVLKVISQPLICQPFSRPS